MTRPTHRDKATGACVFPQGYASDAIEKLPGDHWDRADLEKAWATLRALRSRKLAESDWTQLADTPLPTGLAWRPYRQRLRDLPAATIDPRNPVWPDPPAT